MFDFANSSYTTVVVTVVYSDFFTSTIASGAGRYSTWSLAVGLATVATLLLCPFAGVLADYAGRKKRFLLGSAIACAGGTAALAFVEPGHVATGVALVAISNAAFMLGECFCASFLSDLATRDAMGKISGIGWALGYFGGLASLLLVLALIGGVEAATDPEEYVRRHQLAMVVTGAFFAVASIPTFVLVRERARPRAGFDHPSASALFRAGLREMRGTVEILRAYPVLARFLVAFLVYMAGLYTVINFVGIYAGQELALSQGQKTVMFLVVQLSAAAGAFAFGFVESKIGPKPTILLTLLGWTVGVLAIYFIDDLSTLTGMAPADVFLGLALIVGSAIAATQSSSRAVVGQLAPEGRSSQMFGFWGSFLRLANLLAMSYGLLADAVGLRSALLLVVAFFAAGAILLARTPIREGIRDAARSSDRAP